MPAEVEKAIRDLVDMWISDNNVAALHDAWLVLARHVGREEEAKEVIEFYRH